MLVTSLLSTPIPGRLKLRPRDARGFPIPFTVLISDQGVPDFRVTDIQKWQHAVNYRCCALCGEKMGARVAFIAGPLSHDSRLFTDAPMHLECARYAMAVCPYLALTNTRHARKIPTFEDAVTSVNEHVSTEKPERFFIGVTKTYKAFQMSKGELVLNAGEWESVEWFTPGSILDRNDVDG